MHMRESWSVCLFVFAIMIVDATLAHGLHYYDRICLCRALAQRNHQNNDTLKVPAATKRPLLYMMSQAAP